MKGGEVGEKLRDLIELALDGDGSQAERTLDTNGVTVRGRTDTGSARRGSA